MTRSLCLSRALAGLGVLRAYIAKGEPRAATRRAARSRAAVELLADHLGAGRPGRVSGTREVVVTGTPYLVLYRVKGTTIEILRVYHGAQRWPACLRIRVEIDRYSNSDRLEFA